MKTNLPKRREKPETIEINIFSESESLIGRMLVRGYSENEPFMSRELGLVGNMRNVITYLSRDGMSKESLAKTKLTKRDMIKILSLPKKRVKEYNKILKSVLEDRILSDKILVSEIGKYLGVDSIRLSFTSKDDSGNTYDNMFRYCKILNSLMQDKNFIKVIRELTSFKKKKITINSKVLKGKIKKWNLKKIEI